MKFASIRAAGEALYGAVTEAGFIALSPNFPQWATLTEVI
ncbi:MAG TPA: 2-hydroxyhepta-2,4-diene-1,7-dioate isomerase, partial [Planktomarina temperata]|nr:2-hydroxyhepta-2,4-diene-1,7-dioate isomerase [Planktomarina temperata]